MENLKKIDEEIKQIQQFQDEYKYQKQVERQASHFVCEGKMAQASELIRSLDDEKYMKLAEPAKRSLQARKRTR